LHVCHRYTFPKFNLSWTEFLGLRVRVPDPPLPYIQANYGHKWEMPVKDWDWKKSPANVKENGQWPEDQLDDMVQLFEVEEAKPPPSLQQRPQGQEQKVVVMEVKEKDGLR
jgi:hypothetical protein